MQFRSTSSSSAAARRAHSPRDPSVAGPSSVAGGYLTLGIPIISNQYVWVLCWFTLGVHWAWDITQSSNMKTWGDCLNGCDMALEKTFVLCKVIVLLQRAIHCLPGSQPLPLKNRRPPKTRNNLRRSKRKLRRLRRLKRKPRKAKKRKPRILNRLLLLWGQARRMMILIQRVVNLRD